jgi:D-alanyl-D-alanine carboxypeptidase
VTGRPAAEEITWRIIPPLGLFETYFPAPGDTGLRSAFAHGYEVVDGRVIPRAQLDEMMQNVEMPGGDGLLDYDLGLMKVSLPCGVTAWGHGGDLAGYHSFMAKPLDGPTVSVTFTQYPPETESIADDPRGAVLAAVYCPA